MPVGELVHFDLLLLPPEVSNGNWIYSVFRFLLEKLNHNDIEGWIYDRLGVETTQSSFVRFLPSVYSSKLH